MQFYRLSCFLCACFLFAAITFALEAEVIEVNGGFERVVADRTGVVSKNTVDFSGFRGRATTLFLL
jgi:hypothetical protein